MALQYIDLSERHGHRDDHGFSCGAEFNVKIRRRIDIPDFVRERLSESQIDEAWWEEAQRSREALRDALSRRYKWIGELTFVGRGPGWLAIEDTGCKTRNWDTIGKIVEKYLKEFVTSMEDSRFWTEVAGVAEEPAADHATKTTTGKRLKVGARVEIPVWTDAWMRGDRYGVITKFTAIGSVAHVLLDKSGKIFTVRTKDLSKV